MDIAKIKENAFVNELEKIASDDKKGGGFASGMAGGVVGDLVIGTPVAMAATNWYNGKSNSAAAVKNTIGRIKNSPALGAAKGAVGGAFNKARSSGAANAVKGAIGSIVKNIRK